MILVESIFDKIYLILSVFARDTDVICAVDLSVFDQILRHGITLLPAISFAMNKSSFISLYKLYNKSLASMEAIQHLNATQNYGKKRLEEYGIEMKEVHSTKKKINRKHDDADDQNDQVNGLIEPSRFKEHKSVGWFVNIFGPCTMCIGIFLLSFIVQSFVHQRDECIEKIGVTADCLYPSLYWKNGLFGETSCAFENVTTLVCSHRQLKGSTSIPESYHWSEMINLKTIDIANSTTLEKIPISWGMLPNLVSLDASQTSLINLPYAICAGRSIESLNRVKLDNTPALTRINWSGSIRHHQQTGKDSSHRSNKIEMAMGCYNTFKHNLIYLTLADNALTCPSNYSAHLMGGRKPGSTLQDPKIQVFDQYEHCDFSIVGSFKKLAGLDLSNNSIVGIRTHLLSITRNNQLLNSSSIGINLSNNPITMIVTNALVPSEGNAVLKMLKTNDQYHILTRMSVRLFSMTFLENDINAPRLKDLVLYRYSKLQYLILSNNNFQVFDGSPFQYLTNLKMLDIGECYLSVLKKNTFKGLSKLEYLSIDGTPLIKIEKGAFYGLHQVGILFLDKIQIKHFSNEIFDASMPLLNLTWLKFRETFFRSFDQDCFQGVPNLRHLNIRSNQISQLDFSIFNPLKKLRSLDLERNLISNLSQLSNASSNGRFSVLKEIYLHHNKINTLTNQTFSGNFRSLKILRLEGNKIHTIENGTFEPLTSLLRLCLEGNPIMNGRNTREQFHRLGVIIPPSVKYFDC